MWELIKLELRKVLPFYLPFMAVILIVVVLKKGVLASNDSWMWLAGAVTGASVGYCLFTDPHGTRAFLFSRPFTRSRIVFTRWAIGFVLMAIMVLCAGLFLTAGLRGWIQIHWFQSPWHPLVRWYELNALWSIAGGGILSYGAIIILVTHADNETANGPNKGRFLGTFASWASLVIVVSTFLGASTYLKLITQPFANTFLMSIGYTLLLTITSIISAWHCYRIMPIES